MSDSLWFLLSFIVFWFILYKVGLFGFILNKIDARRQTIDNDLKEARRLREDADRLLTEYRQRVDNASREADALIKDAQAAAAQLLAKSEEDIASLQQYRHDEFAKKVALLDKQAISNVQNRVVSIVSSVVSEIAISSVEKIPTFTKHELELLNNGIVTSFEVKK